MDQYVLARIKPVPGSSHPAKRVHRQKDEADASPETSAKVIANMKEIAALLSLDGPGSKQNEISTEEREAIVAAGLRAMDDMKRSAADQRPQGHSWEQPPASHYFCGGEGCQERLARAMPEAEGLVLEHGYRRDGAGVYRYSRAFRDHFPVRSREPAWEGGAPSEPMIPRFPLRNGTVKDEVVKGPPGNETQVSTNLRYRDLSSGQEKDLVVCKKCGAVNRLEPFRRKGAPS